MVLPCASVMVMVVLLNDEFTCAMPDAMFLRSRRRTRVASLPIGLFSSFKRVRDSRRWGNSGDHPALASRIGSVVDTKLLLLAGDGLGRTLARARVGVGPLTAHRKA